MDDLVPAFFVTLVGALLAVLQASRFARWESTVLIAAFAAHVFSAFVQIWFTKGLYGGGDLFGYTWSGETIAAVLRADFPRFGPEVLRLLFHQVAVLPVEGFGGGSSTGAMQALAGFLTYFTSGSTYTLCLIVAVAAHFGTVALYQAFSASFPEMLHPRLAFASMLVPSLVFWSSALLKEAVAMAGLGYLMLGMVRFKQKFSLLAAAQFAFGGLVIALIKAYILFPVVLAAGAWFYLESGNGKSRVVQPAHLLFGMAVAASGVIVLGRLFPEYALDNLAEQAASHQEAGMLVRGASTYSIGDPTQTTLTGQLAFAPLALITSLFRPFLFESTNVQIGVNALETTAILFLSFRALLRRGLAGTWALLSRSPMLVFCTLFTLSFGVAVGLTTTNLGALSRYRMPLVPFLWALVLVLDAKNYYVTAPAEAPAPILLRKRAL